MQCLPNLKDLSSDEKDELIRQLWQENQSLQAQLSGGSTPPTPEKTSSNSSLPPSADRNKPDKPQKTKRQGPRQGSLGRAGGGRPLTENPDQTMILKPGCCSGCGAPFSESDLHVQNVYEKIEIPEVKPHVTRVERYEGHCPHCGTVTPAPTPDGYEEGSPFSARITAMALYLRVVHAISYQRLSRLFQHLFGLSISEGALDSAFQRAHPQFEDRSKAILARLRRSRVVFSDETTVSVNGRKHWNWVFQNKDVVLHVIRPTRSATVVEEVMGGHRPTFWISDLYGGQRGHAEKWQICLAHQLRDCQYAIESGDKIFAPRMKATLLRMFVVARRRNDIAESTRRRWICRLNNEISDVMALTPVNRHGIRLRKRYGSHRDSLLTFLEDKEVPPDNNSSERELRPTATYRKNTGGFRSSWGPSLFANVRSTLGTAARHGVNAFKAIYGVLTGNATPIPDEATPQSA
jgi:transposase